jgi:polyhydroxyalkanoate synthase subunit PhaC
MFWGVGTSNATLEQVRADLERMQAAYGAVYQRLLGVVPPEPMPADELVCAHGQRLMSYHNAPAALAPGDEAGKLHNTALLCVPSLINPLSLLDLGPGRSLIGYLLKHGASVYSTQWQQPTVLDRALTLDFYVEFVRAAIVRVAQETGQARVALLGYCSGGTLSAIVAALHPELLSNLVLLAAPINFHDDGLLSQWLRFGIGDVDLTLDTLALMPPPLMRASLQMLQPTLQIAQQVALQNQLGDTVGVRDLLALQSWLGASVFMPLEVYRTLIKACYRNNALLNGQLVVGGQAVDLGAISAPLLVATAAHDRICPPASATVLLERVASTATHHVELGGGHLSLLAGRGATQTLWPQLGEWLSNR